MKPHNVITVNVIDQFMWSNLQGLKYLFIVICEWLDSDNVISLTQSQSDHISGYHSNNFSLRVK